jgi:F0F1-type ATP synthase assembly protein I
MQPDDRSSLAKALDLASQVTSIGLMMVLPVGGGYWLDQEKGTKPLYMILGLMLGMAVAGLQFVKLIQRVQSQNQQDDRSQSKKSE